jgi:hypothetical protein
MSSDFSGLQRGDNPVNTYKNYVFAGVDLLCPEQMLFSDVFPISSRRSITRSGCTPRWGIVLQVNLKPL